MEIARRDGKTMTELAQACQEDESLREAVEEVVNTRLAREEGKIFYAVRNDDGTYSEPQLLGNEIDMTVVDEDPPTDEDVRRIFTDASKEVSIQVGVAAEDIERLLWELMSQFERASRKMVEELSPGLEDVAKKMRETFADVYKVDPPSRSGFKPRRKKWESSKDDPSTFGGYMSKRHKKKRR